jgi:hypothetical protein
VASKELTPVEVQGDLPLARKVEPNEVPAEMIRRQKSAAGAFALACQSSGLEDKEIYLALGIDAGYFARIRKGEATLQADLVAMFCDTVGNRIYPEWLAYSIGCTLVQIKSEAERQLEAERARRVEAEKENKLLRELVRGRATA